MCGLWVGERVEEGRLKSKERFEGGWTMIADVRPVGREQDGDEGVAVITE